MVENKRNIKRRRKEPQAQIHRQQALVHNANERARYRSIKEQISVLSLHVPGNDKESVHSTLCRIRLFNQCLEYLNCRLEGRDIDHFPVEEKLAFISSVPKDALSIKGIGVHENEFTKKKDIPGRPHVVRFDSKLGAHDSNRKVFSSKGFDSKEYQSCPNLIKVSHEPSELPSIDLNASNCQNSVGNIIEKRNETRFSDCFSTTGRIAVNTLPNKTVNSELPTTTNSDVVILKYEQCHLYLNDYGKESLQVGKSSLTDSNLSRLENEAAQDKPCKNSNQIDHSEQYMTTSLISPCYTESCFLLSPVKLNEPSTNCSLDGGCLQGVINSSKSGKKCDEAELHFSALHQSSMSSTLSDISNEVPAGDLNEDWKCNADKNLKALDWCSGIPEENVSIQLPALEFAEKKLSFTSPSVQGSLSCDRPRRSCQRKKCFYDNCCNVSSVVSSLMDVSNSTGMLSDRPHGHCKSIHGDSYKGSCKKTFVKGFKVDKNAKLPFTTRHNDLTCYVSPERKPVSCKTRSSSIPSLCLKKKNLLDKENFVSKTSPKCTRMAHPKQGKFRAKKTKNGREKCIGQECHLRGRKLLSKFTNTCE